MEILGYSERGIINSLVFSIVEASKSNGEDLKLMNEFIGLIDIPELQEFGEPSDYEILLEQSFSGFGDADLIIIIHYKKPEDKKVLFIEGKVKTSQRKNWSLEKQFKDFEKSEKYNGYSSNLFYQLYLKSLLFKNKHNIKWEENEISNADDIIAYCGFRNRKIGGNKIVWKAMKKIDECKEAFYVGLVPSSCEDIKPYVKKHIDFKNGKGSYKVNFLKWKTVERFCNENELEKVIEIFEYNKGQIYEPKSESL